MKAAKRTARNNTRKLGTQPLRIVGGEWRGRKLSFPAVEGLRPTGDRIRETLFNWLAPVLPGARCLDLYAGSGALGLEALSRGAEFSLMLEKDLNAAAQLRTNLSLLNCERGQIHTGDSLDWLRAGPQQPPFDVVFIDPPFQQTLWQTSIDLLEDKGWLAPNAAVYIESGHDLTLTYPEHWQLYRDKSSGQVRYRLFWVNPNDGAA